MTDQPGYNNGEIPCHVAGSLNYTNGAALLYVNGIQIASMTMSFAGGYGNTQNTPSGDDTTVGSATTFQYMDGRLDEVRIYNSVESAATIASIAGVPAVSPNGLGGPQLPGAVGQPRRLQHLADQASPGSRSCGEGLLLSRWFHR